MVVLSYGYWQQRFGQNPNVIGQTVRIDGISRRIIGVMPAGVRFPYADTQFVTPVAFKGGDPIDPWRTFDLRIFGRLKDGVTPAQAQAELHRLHAALLPLFPWRMPDTWASDLTVVPLLESEVGATRPRLLLLFGAVVLILLIACANVANLMLARAAGREREMAVRGALGASSGRLMQQLLSESVLVGALAGIAGLLAAAASLQGLVRLLPADTPRLNEISLALEGISVCSGCIVDDRIHLWTDPGAEDGIAQPAGSLALEQPRRGGQSIAVPGVDGAGDGPDRVIGGGDYCELVCCCTASTASRRWIRAFVPSESSPRRCRWMRRHAGRKADAMASLPPC